MSFLRYVRKIIMLILGSCVYVGPLTRKSFMTLNFTTEDAGIILTTTSVYPVIIENRLTTHRGATCRPGGEPRFLQIWLVANSQFIHLLENLGTISSTDHFPKRGGWKVTCVLTYLPCIRRASRGRCGTTISVLVNQKQPMYQHFIVYWI